MPPLRFFIKTYGCSHNISDSERMISLLLGARYKLTNSLKEADFIVVNTCTVKTPTEQKILSYLRQISKLKKPIIVAGCLAQSNFVKSENSFGSIDKELKNFSIIGVDSIEKIVEVAKKCLKGRRAVALNDDKEIYKSANHQTNPLIKIIPISSGCLGACAYCKTKLARANLCSRKIEDIVSEIKIFLKNGIYEFWLSSEDCGAFGIDLETNILDLLKAVEAIPGEFKVRLGMANPEHLYPIRHELADFFLKTKNFYKFLHIPIQSGNNDILKAMNRKYSTEEVRALIKNLRSRNPDITLATDIICGFPGETKEQFLDTANLIKDLQFDVFNISKFWPLNGTIAAKMPNQINNIEKMRRSKSIKSSFEKSTLKRNEFWKKWSGEIFINEKKNKCTFVGRNYAYKPIVVRSQENLLGKRVNIKISEVRELFLRGEIINLDK